MFEVWAYGSGSEYLRYQERESAEKAYWEGRGSELLGLSEKVIRERDFQRLVTEGVSPDGEVLRGRKRSIRMGKEGEKLSTPRNIYDCLAVAPKSVALLGLWDRRLDEAHRRSVGYLQKAMEQVAAARVRVGGESRDRMTGNLVMAKWEHQYTRRADVLRHTHIGVVNLTFDAAENKWKALQAANFYKHAVELGEVYAHVMARETEKLGYEVIDRPGWTRGWEVAGVPESAMVKFSQRSADREAARRGFIEHHGRNPTSREVGVLVRNHRPEKEIIPWEELREKHFERMSVREYKQLERIGERAMSQGYTYDMRQKVEIEQVKSLVPRRENSMVPGYEFDMRSRGQGPYNFEPPPKLLGENGGTGSEAQAAKVDPAVLDSAWRFALRDHVDSEPGNHIEPWDYLSTDRKKGHRQRAQ